jgi:hypothetical protein
MNTLALWIGYVVLVSAGVALTAGVVYAAVYWTTYAINNSHQRAAETIAGKGWMKLLQEAAEKQKETP